MRILEEHASPFLKCKKCRKQVLPWLLNNCHYELDKCRIMDERQRRWENLQQCFEASRVFISVNLEPMEPTTSLPYLGRTFAYNDRNWAYMY